MVKSTKLLASNSHLAKVQTSKVSDKLSSLTASGSLGASELRTVKCYRCYSYDVTAICHHCGRFLCNRCLRMTSSRLFVDNVFAYLKPSLGNKLKRGAHCRDCFHWNFQFGPILVLLMLLLVTFFIITRSNLDWLQRIMLTGEILIIGLVSWLVDRLRLHIVTYPIGFPLFSKLKVELLERIEANFNVNDCSYLSPEPVAQGVIRITLSVSPNDQERLKSVPSPKFPLKLQAGFVALETLKNVEFVRHTGLRHRKNLLLLTKKVDRNTFESHCRQSKNFYLLEPYRIQSDVLQIGPPHDREFPLAIKPRRADGGYRLEIIFEIVSDLKLKFAKSSTEKKSEDKKGLEGKPVLNSLALNIPIGCEVEFTDGHFDQQKRVIRWYKSALDVKPAFSVFVRFQQIIPNDIEFKGEYNVTINNWTISQLHIAQDVKAPNRYLVRPTNGLRISTSNEDEKELEWLAPIVEHSTTIEGKLYINTSFLLSQQVQTLSDLLEEENTQTEITSEEKLLVAPTYHVVNAIVKTLIKEKVFIKQVTEIPGHVTETNIGGNRARYWKIWGKYYSGDTLQPADLYLVISGDGPQNDRPNCEGALTLELGLRSYIEMRDTETPKRLKDMYKIFKNIIRIAAYQGRQVDYQGQRILAWQREKQFECELQRTNSSINKVAVILTDSNKPKQGYIFIVSSDEIEQPPKWLKHMEIYRIKWLPVIEIPGCEWVDKWKLLREIEIGADYGRKGSFM